jgi:hypothetical protein
MFGAGAPDDRLVKRFLLEFLILADEYAKGVAATGISRSLQVVEACCKDGAQPDGDEAKRNGQPDIGDRLVPFTIPCQIQRLQAKR